LAAVLCPDPLRELTALPQAPRWILWEGMGKGKEQDGQGGKGRGAKGWDGRGGRKDGGRRRGRERRGERRGIKKGRKGMTGPQISKRGRAYDYNICHQPSQSSSVFDRLHTTLCFINFSRHSIIADRDMALDSSS